MTISSSGTPLSERKAITAVRCTETQLVARLSDEREIAAPLAWYPRLGQASAEARDNWKLVGGGYGVHWPDIDEDISLKMLIDGVPSVEARASVD